MYLTEKGVPSNYIGIISGLIAFVYPQEPMAKINQLAEQLDILRFYYHHWMLLSVPLLRTLLGLHKPSYKRVWVAPVGLLLLMLFVMLNQIFQSELGFVPLRSDQNFLASAIRTRLTYGVPVLMMPLEAFWRFSRQNSLKPFLWDNMWDKKNIGRGFGLSFPRLCLLRLSHSFYL